MNLENFRIEFNGKSNLGNCYKIYELDNDAFLYVGQVFCKSTQKSKVLEYSFRKST
jgi:hypothetical protein